MLELAAAVALFNINQGPAAKIIIKKKKHFLTSINLKVNKEKRTFFT